MKPIVKNTWGDAFYFVFDTVDGGGKFALLLRDLFNTAKWVEKNLPSTLAIRISMHAAPVFPCVDAVLEEANYTGVHTSRGARIEPITVPGSVYCSRAFACLTQAMGVSDFDCPFIGNVPLAKGYGMLPIHVVAWKDEGQRKGPQAVQRAKIQRRRSASRQSILKDDSTLGRSSINPNVAPWKEALNKNVGVSIIREA